MVNRVLTSTSLLWITLVPRDSAHDPEKWIPVFGKDHAQTKARLCSRMPMMTAERAPSSPTATAVDGRSPFVRLTELIAGIEPGKPVINLSVGEPQHPIPSFVGPTLAAHLAEFGRYPANKGIEPFRRAVAAWLGRRYKLARPVDPEHEVLVLNGTREGLFLAAIAATRFVAPRAGKPAMLIPNPFYAAYSAGALAAGCEP